MGTVDEAAAADNNMAYPAGRRSAHLEELQWRFQLQLSSFAPTWVSGYDGKYEEPTASAMPWVPGNDEKGISKSGGGIASRLVSEVVHRVKKGGSGMIRKASSGKSVKDGRSDRRDETDDVSKVKKVESEAGDGGDKKDDASKVKKVESEAGDGEVPTFEYLESVHYLERSRNHAQSILDFLEEKGDAPLTKAQEEAVRKEMALVQKDVVDMGKEIEDILEGHVQSVVELRNLVDAMAVEVLGDFAKEQAASGVSQMKQMLTEKHEIASAFSGLVKDIADADIGSGTKQLAPTMRKWMGQMKEMEESLADEEVWFESFRNVMISEYEILVDLPGNPEPMGSGASSASSSSPVQQAARLVLAKIDDCLMHLSAVRARVIGPAMLP